MRQSLQKRLADLEAANGPRRHTVWNEGQNVAAEIAALIASGRAQPTDKFIAVSWRAGGPNAAPPGRR
jgi:hypothetical protein